MFFLGAFTATLYFSNTDFTDNYSTNESSNTLTKNESADIAADPRGRLAIDVKQISIYEQLSDDYRNFLNTLTPEKKIAIFQNAVIDGSPDSLQKINSQVLSFMPDYYSVILPVLKENALNTLLSKFRDSDWKDWSISSISNEGGATLARSYVDKIFYVNNELGKYVETAAFMFNRLYLATKKGDIFYPEEELNKVIQMLEKENRLSVLINTKQKEQIVDTQILFNQNFKEKLEAYKQIFIYDFFIKNPENYAKTLSLILSVNSENLSPEILDYLESMLRKFAVDATPKFREEIFKIIINNSRLSQLARNNPGVRKNLAQLYLISALDAIENKDARKSSVYLDESVNLLPGLRSQAIISAEIRKMVQNGQITPTSMSGSRLLDTEDKGDTKQKGKLKNTLKEGLYYLSAIFVGLIFLGGVIVIIYLFKNKLGSEADVSEEKIIENDRALATLDLDKTEMEKDFEEEFQIGKRARQG
ncbi:MAG: hypothetical protein KBC84_08815 [Proteobacteria bacterium]|nr:hypothetical protein [Pseudomonadota bacterium]